MKYLNLKGIKIAAVILSAFLIFISCNPMDEEYKNMTSNYDDLTELFKEWRAFETPPIKDGAPDYTKVTFDKRYPEYKKLKAKLMNFDKRKWKRNQIADWYVILAEMNGYDFNHRILKPWERDPAFYKSFWTYKSDTPAHEGPTHHMTTEIWTYKFPLSSEEEKRLLNDLSVIPALNTQAKMNLTGNAKELWITGIRDIRFQSMAMASFLKKQEANLNEDLKTAFKNAISSSDDLVEWLEEEGKSKTGPSGIGKDNYTWYQQNVHLVPLTWDDEVMILKRELARAWSSLKLEEHRNRNLPQLTDASTEEEFNKLADASATSIMNFLRDQEIVTVKDYFEPALREHLGQFQVKEKRNFFNIGAHYDPRPLYSHFYHWFELARMDIEPNKSLIRRGPLLYNIFDSRNEGTSTAVEEMFMHAGLYDDSPRSREIVYIMIAQRAARGLGSLYAHANELTMEEAGGIHSEYTPRGWMKTEKELLIFEQHLYLRQPGYGASYITGKYLLETALADYGKMKEDNNEAFKLKDFFDELNAIGNIPISLGRYQMTGLDDQLNLIMKK